MAEIVWTNAAADCLEKIHDYIVREILYSHYRIAYLIKTESCVEVLGVFHGAMDIERYLK